MEFRPLRSAGACTGQVALSKASFATLTSLDAGIADSVLLRRPRYRKSSSAAAKSSLGLALAVSAAPVLARLRRHGQRQLQPRLCCAASLSTLTASFADLGASGGSLPSSTGRGDSSSSAKERTSGAVHVSLPQRPPRRLVVLAGQRKWAEQQVSEALRLWREKYSNLRELVADNPRADKPPPLEKWMGQELDAAVLYAMQPNFQDSFGAICGALRGGGVFVLCTPPLKEWREESAGRHWCACLEGMASDPESVDFINIISEEEQMKMLQDDRLRLDWAALCPQSPRTSITGSGTQGSGESAGLVPTEEQQQLIEAVLRTSSSSPLLVSGRRGRGKSAALGMAASLLLRRGSERVLVTSPSQESTWQLFEAAAAYLGDSARREGPFKLCVGQRGTLESGSLLQPSCLRALGPDCFEFADGAPLFGLRVHELWPALSQVIASGGHALLRASQYLFIDEAAGLPVAEAIELLSRSRRVVMSTTLDGYEGSGQGFLLRALPKLREARKDLRHLQLRTPLRWGQGCPLERLADAALMLDAQPAPAEAVEGVRPESVSFEQLDAVHLVSRQGASLELERIFGLLRCSHYKTKPSDLQCFLECPGVRWYVLRYNGEVVGVTIVGIEDAISESKVAEAVYLRQRRAPGQLIAQILSTEAGFLEATSYRFVRVLRLCIHPAAQRRGLGALLLQETLRDLRELEGIDAMGACFGATPWLLRLWRQVGARLVWVAHGSEPSSGHHSATVLIPISPRSQSLLTRLQERLALQLPELLLGPLNHLDSSMLSCLLGSLPVPGGCPEDEDAPNPQDVADVRSFAWGARNLSCCRYALVRAALCALRPPRVELAARFEMEVMDLLQGRPTNDSLLRQAFRELPWARNRDQT
ncbi:unnamed protein product [Polarella glacialis]|uniref:N-acetyltransferase domain-containing protein n=1 Tax=Polarella glacialis TaxID=89957 RepID=A0A813LS13_POLGL|nr:unnamed protein product [Polarella glacialis]